VIEASFEVAISKVKRALLLTEDLPHTPYRSWAKDNLQAGLGWLQQAYNEWLTEQADHE
jgi:hypothetical protein